MSRNNVSSAAPSRNTSTSTSARTPLPSTSNGASHNRRQELDAQLDALDAEIGSVDSEMAKLTTLRAQLVRQKNELMKQIEHTSSARPTTSNILANKGKAKAVGIDYSEDWDWSPDLKARMQRVFQIQDFRLVQKGSVFMFPCLCYYSDAGPSALPQCGMQLSLQIVPLHPQRHFIVQRQHGPSRHRLYHAYWFVPAAFSLVFWLILSQAAENLSPTSFLPSFQLVAPSLSHR